MTDVEKNFASWFDFATTAADDSRLVWRSRMSHRSDRDGGWYGTDTFERAVNMALRTGWPEGRKLLSDSLAVVRPKPEPFRSLEFSVAGAFPSVPMYCAGDPECMVIDPGSDIRHSKPIIKIDYNISVNASVGARALMLRGAAVVSLAETLERRGYSTELRILDDSKAGNQIYRLCVTYKKAGEPLDLDRAAFAIANPATLRRFSFAIMEQTKELEANFSHGYGHAIQAKQSTDSSIIFVPGPDSRETPESARKAVELAAQDLTAEISEAQETGDD